MLLELNKQQRFRVEFRFESNWLQSKMAYLGTLAGSANASEQPKIDAELMALHDAWEKEMDLK